MDWFKAGAIGWLVSLVAAAGHATEVGVPPLRVYTPDDYAAHGQNWDIVQGPDGLIYVGNGTGVLQFDGARWQLYATPHGTRVRRVLAGAPGHLLAATTDDLLDIDIAAAPFPSGRVQSLTGAWPVETKTFGEAMGLARSGGGLYLQANHRVIRIDANGALRHYESSDGFQQSFAVADTWYVLDRARGLLRIAASGAHQGELELAPDGERLAGDQVTFMLRRRDGEIVLGSRKLGLLRYRDGHLESWHTDLDVWIQEQIAVPAVELADGNLVLGSLRAGLARIDRDGHAVQFLDERDGLPSNTVYALATDNQGNLWAGFDGGIARIAWPGALSSYDRRQGVSTVWGIARHRGRLLLATRLGLLAANEATVGRSLNFERVPGQPTQAWELLSVGDALWIAGSDGVWRIRDTHAAPGQWLAEKIFASRFAYSLLRDVRDADLVYAATDQGVVRISALASMQPVAMMLPGYSGEARQLAQDSDTTLWAGTPNGRLLRLPVGSDAVQVLDQSAGLPPGMSWPIALDGRTLFGSVDGLRSYDGMRVDAAPEFSTTSALCKGVARAAQTRSDELWIACADYTGVARRTTAGEWRFDPYPLGALPNETVYAFHRDADGVIWIGRERSLLRFDPRLGTDTPTAAAGPVVRGVYAIGPQGYTPLSGSHSDLPWPAGTDRLRVRFSLPVFALAERASFMTRLDGIDSDWVPAFAEAQRDFTNLDGGHYRFRLAAIAPGMTRHETQIEFDIARPWFRQGWAWALWLLLAAAAVLGLGLSIARWRLATIAARNRALETLVAERTDQLRHQAERLKALDQAKSRFYAGLAHDFRTPLTLIIEPLRELMRGLWGQFPEAAGTQLERVARNATQVKRMVDSLLDLQALEARPPLHARALDAANFVRQTVAHFSGLAEQRGIDLVITAPAAVLTVWADPQALEKVLFNLLGNAFKYTPDGGSVRLTLGADSTMLSISVEDSGPGISADDLPHLFDHYFRGHDAVTRRLPGSGLGLALCRELLERHGGSIAASNGREGGARFDVRLPLGDAHLDPRDRDASVEALVEPNAQELQDLQYLGGAAHTPVSRMADEDATTVLVVDDNAELRAFLIERLRYQYRVLEAEDGEAALALARSALPDLIVSDVEMPRRDGLELTRALKADPETDIIPILLLASRGAIEERIAGFDVGADDYLVKPFHASELVARVAALIGSRRQLRARLAAVAEPAATPAIVDEDPFAIKVRIAIAQRLGDSRFGVAELADAVHVERSTLFKRLKALDLPAPVHLIREQRLVAAADMLASGRGQVTEVAYACGFESLSYFSRAFKERFAKSPREYVRAHL